MKPRNPPPADSDGDTEVTLGDVIKHMNRKFDWLNQRIEDQFTILNLKIDRLSQDHSRTQDRVSLVERTLDK